MHTRKVITSVLLAGRALCLHAVVRWRGAETRAPARDTRGRAPASVRQRDRYSVVSKLSVCESDRVLRHRN